MSVLNCYNCKYLEWVEAEIHDPMGYMCNKRQYKNENEERMHLFMLENKSDLEKGKVCCEIINLTKERK